MLELQPIVERVPEAMGPMEERQGNEHKKIEPYYRVRKETVEMLVVGGLEPSQGKGEASQKEVDGEEKRGDRPAGAEQDPVGSSLPSQAHDHGLGGQIEPRHGMEEDKEEGNGIEGKEEGRPQTGEEPSVCLGPL